MLIPFMKPVPYSVFSGQLLLILYPAQLPSNWPCPSLSFEFPQAPYCPPQQHSLYCLPLDCELPERQPLLSFICLVSSTGMAHSIHSEKDLLNQLVFKSKDANLHRIFVKTLLQAFLALILWKLQLIILRVKIYWVPTMPQALHCIFNIRHLCLSFIATYEVDTVISLILQLMKWRPGNVK